MFALGDLAVDLERRVVKRGPYEATLTPIEAALLAYLRARPGEIVSREDLLRDVWQYSERATTRAVDFTVMRLRRKIEPVPDQPVHLRSVRGAGYRLELDAAPADPDFVGRGEAVERLGVLLATARCVTVTGPGGVGKTRLVRHLLSTRPPSGPAPFLSLADARAPGDVAHAVAVRLGLGPDADAAVVGEALAAGPATLLVLDNLEQVPGVGAVVAAWLDAAPGLRVLCTSRSPLDVPGERPLPLDPLAPADAARLFLDRAAAARASLETDDPEDAAVQGIVAAVDGLPLGVELAAARCAVMTVRQLAARLSLPLLAAPGATGRHATMAGTVRWSWDLLGADEQRALARCSVFRGPFDLDAAEAVLGPHATDLLERLVRAALVRAEAEEALRFSLLVSVRELAAAELPDQDPAFERHARHVLAVTEPLAHALRHERQDPDLLDALAGHFDNLVAVTERFGGTPWFVRATLALAPLLEVRGPAALLRDLLDRAVAIGGDLRAELLWARGRTRYVLGEPGALDDLDGALALAGPALAPYLHAARGDHLQSIGRYEEALSAYDLALPVFVATGDRFGEARVTGGRGLAFVELHRLSEARDALHAALAIVREVGDVRGEVVGLDHLATAEVLAGRPAVARARYEEALERAPALRDRRIEANVRTHLGNALLRLGDVDGAVACWRSALQVHRELHNLRFQSICLGNLGRVALAAERWGEARDRFEQARRASARIGDRAVVAALTSSLGQTLHADGLLAEARRELESAWAEQRALGRARSAAVTSAALGVLLREQGDADGALAAWAAAAGHGLDGFLAAHRAGLWTATGDGRAADERSRAVDLGGADLLAVLDGAARGEGLDAAVARRLAR